MELSEDELKHSDKMLQEDWNKEFNYAGSFQTKLMELIQAADYTNMKKLYTVYPNIVNAFWNQ